MAKIKPNASQTINCRVDRKWISRVANLLNIVGKPLAADRSELIRMSVDEYEILFVHSPYFAMSSKHFLFVSATGDLHYWSEEDIRILEHRSLLPFSICLNPPKKEYFLESASNLSELRDRWLLNYFSARNKGTSAETPLADDIDDAGLLEKAVDLPIDRGVGVPLIRERMGVLRNFVQHELDNNNILDSAGIPVDIPTLDFTIHIVIDRYLYRRSPLLLENVRAGYGFRNLDGAKFKRHLLGAGKNETTFHSEVFPESDASNRDSLYDRTLRSVQATAERYLRRLRQVTGADRKTLHGRTIVDDRALREALSSTQLPNSYLFGEFRWAKPYVGTVVDMTWNRPPAQQQGE